ncbi:MAG TPA: sulfite exporter TauE/SafE family protein [Bacteroidales bacterium]|nr:sulfite exporter TauE/SafE family protein [Bacteroidales bacterium]HPO66597.1 sulfite exporter TauE/SafE family protein [Bacteroidales bacterium]
MIFTVAFLYASVGHGGASGYMALMVLYGLSPIAMRSSVLVMNIIVSTIAFLLYYRGQHFKMILFWPFVVTAIPMAFLGALTPMHGLLFRMLLMACLLLGIYRLIFNIHRDAGTLRPLPIPLALCIGGCIGYISGLIGIGGGILLSPVLLLMRWANQKEAAAVSAPFILSNSIVGLLGTLHNQTFIFNKQLLIMITMATVGGILGSFMGSFKWKPKFLNYVLAFVLLIASIKLIVS